MAFAVMSRVQKKWQNKLKVVVMGDDMGIPLATDDVMCSTGKSKIEDVEGSGALSVTRQKLECVFTVEKNKTEFDVCEIFSRPRVCQVGKDLVLRGRYSLNRDTKDMHTNKSWNFLEKEGSGQVDYTLGEDTDSASHCIPST